MESVIYCLIARVWLLGQMIIKHATEVNSKVNFNISYIADIPRRLEMDITKLSGKTSSFIAFVRNGIEKDVFRKSNVNRNLETDIINGV